MAETLEELKKILKNLKKEDIIFKPYFYTKNLERPYLNEEFVIQSLKNINNLMGFQKQLTKGEQRYRIGIKLSNKYALVIVSQIKDKNLYIITAWKTSRKWQKAIQK